MPLTQLQANVVLQWAMSKSNMPFAPTTQGIDGVEYNLADLNSIFNKIFTVSEMIAGSGTYTIDLTSLTDLINEAIDFSAILLLFMLPTGSSVSIAPGVSNGLQIFGTTSPVDVPVNGVLFWGGNPAGTGLTVDSTHKTLTFTNLTATAATLELVIAGDG